jgi:hypothetical protein
LAALTVFTYQGALTLLAAYLGGFLTAPMIGEISATGGVLIMGLGVAKRLRVANYLPALLIAPLVVVILTMMGWVSKR